MMRAARVLSVETDTAYALRVRNFSEHFTWHCSVHPTPGATDGALLCWLRLRTVDCQSLRCRCHLSITRVAIHSPRITPLPGLFPLPPTRPASVVPGLSTSAPRRGVYWQTGTHPRKVSHRRSACGPGAARPLIQKRSRRCTSAHTKAPDGPGSQRSGPGSSRRRPAAAGRLHRYPLLLRPIASMQVCAAGVDRPYPFFLLLLSLLARAGDTGGIEQTGQNHETMGTLERPTQSG